MANVQRVDPNLVCPAFASPQRHHSATTASASASAPPQRPCQHSASTAPAPNAGHTRHRTSGTVRGQTCCCPRRQKKKSTKMAATQTTTTRMGETRPYYTLQAPRAWVKHGCCWHQHDQNYRSYMGVNSPQGQIRPYYTLQAPDTPIFYAAGTSVPWATSGQWQRIIGAYLAKPITAAHAPATKQRPTNVSRPHTAPTNVSRPHMAPTNVPRPHTAPTNVSRPHTATKNVSRPHTAPTNHQQQQNTTIAPIIRTSLRSETDKRKVFELLLDRPRRLCR